MPNFNDENAREIKLRSLKGHVRRLTVKISFNFSFPWNFRKENLIEYLPDPIRPNQWKNFVIKPSKNWKGFKVIQHIVCSNWIAKAESLAEKKSIKIFVNFKLSFPPATTIIISYVMAHISHIFRSFFRYPAISAGDHRKQTRPSIKTVRAL